MWIVRVPPEKIADDRRTFQCPRCEHLLANVPLCLESTQKHRYRSAQLRYSAWVQSSVTASPHNVRFTPKADMCGAKSDVRQLSTHVSACEQTQVCFAVYPEGS